MSTVFWTVVLIGPCKGLSLDGGYRSARGTHAGAGRTGHRDPRVCPCSTRVLC